MSLAGRTEANRLESGRSDRELYAQLSGSKLERDRAFAEIYHRYSPNVYRYCLKILQDESAAQDVFQDTFLRILKHAESKEARKEPVNNLPAFLLRVARNLCLNVKRDASRKPQGVEISEERETAHDRDAETLMGERELSELLLKSIELLPEHQQEAIALQTYGGLSYEEIGEVMNVPVSTVRNWIVRGKERLRKIITPYLREPSESQSLKTNAINSHS